MNKIDTTYTLYIQSTPAKVWDALTNGKISPQYFFGRRVESDWQVGSPWKMWMPNPFGEGEIVDSEGVVDTHELHHRLGFTWRVMWVPEMRGFPEGYVIYTIDDVGQGVTRLRMDQSHASPVEEKWLEMGRKGWAVILSGLKTLLETGKPLPQIDMSR